MKLRLVTDTLDDACLSEDAIGLGTIGQDACGTTRCHRSREQGVIEIVIVPVFHVAPV